MPRQPRKPGKPDSLFSSDPEFTVKEILKSLPMFIRRDYGGKDPRTVIHNRLSEKGIPFNSDTLKAYELGENWAIHGVKTRMTPRLNWLIQLFK